MRGIYITFHGNPSVRSDAVSILDSKVWHPRCVLIQCIKSG